jgi:RimJ/RimL family protein N-acetyltransferase/quercetin dioxygenase-like cupin family protein
MISTERLLLRPFRAEDLPAFVAYRRRPEVARYQSWDAAYSMADAERFLASQQGAELGQPGEWVQLAAIDRESGELCGDCAVRVAADQPATAELGVTLAPEHQARGLAGEALAAVIGRLFEEHDIHRIYAETDDRNVGVHRLVERLGFRCEARLVEADWFKGEWTTLRVYAILRREWSARAVAMRDEPVVIDQRDREWTSWPEHQAAARGDVWWKTLISGGLTPTATLAVGVARIAPGARLEPHRHDQTEIYFVLEGAGELTIGGETRRVEPGNAVFIPGGAVHSIACAGRDELRFAYVFAADSTDDVVYDFDV